MTENVIPLLETKLHAPRRRDGAVGRPRLRERLEERGQPALPVGAAPAGFGKTTRLTELFADVPAAAWLSLDRRDDDPARFWTYVIAALQTKEPDVGRDAQALLQLPRVDLDGVIETLLNDLDAVDHDLMLLLDDYHVIESPEIHRTMAFMVDHLPPHMRLAIASRADPPLPLASMRARGELLEYRAPDLAFTADEAAAYLHGTMGLAVEPADLEVLEARTEGWIAALQLAALSMRDRDDLSAFIAGFAGDDRFVLDYLVGEVLERQSDDLRSFLLETSVLDTLTGPLCDAVTGRGDGQSTLEYLDRSNLFLVPLDDRRTWYRYHHLFADMLRARLLHERPARVAELHGRASAWYDEHGDRGEAIRHAMAGEHFDAAARLIELAAPAMHQVRQEMTLRRWLEVLPETVFADRPVLTIHLVGTRMSTGDPTGVLPLLELVEAALDRDDPPPIVFDQENYARLPAQLAVYRAGLALLAGDLDATIGHATRALDLSRPMDHLQRGGAAALTGLASWTRGDLDAARRQYTDAVESLIAAGHLSDALGCSLGLADIQLAQGRLEDAFQTLTAGLRHATAVPGMRGTADMHVGLSEVFLERDDRDTAAGHLQTGTDLGDHAGLPQNAYRRRVALARLQHARDDLDGALGLLEEAKPFYNTDFSPSVRSVDARIARLQLVRGDVRAAERWAADRSLTPDDEITYVREFDHLTLARILLARHAAHHDDPQSVERAIGLLDRLLAAAEEGQRSGSTIEILVVLALARHAANDGPGSTAALAKALALAEPEGYVRLFVDESPAMTALLRSVEPEGPAGRHARRVLAATETEPPAVRPRTGLVDDLSARELDVLRLLRTDLSGPDIARELIVSLNTFRTHTKSIYTKLAVNNRREAIRRATELGL